MGRLSALLPAQGPGMEWSVTLEYAALSLASGCCSSFTLAGQSVQKLAES